VRFRQKLSDAPNLRQNQFISRVDNNSPMPNKKGNRPK
jgi:hypothetical protein